MCAKQPQTQRELFSGDGAQQIADAWRQALLRINPGLVSPAVRDQLLLLTEQLIAALGTKGPVIQAGINIGLQMEGLDVLQPQDMVAIQESLAHALSLALRPEIAAQQQSRIAAALFGLAAGYYAGKSERVAKYNVSLTSRMSHDLKTPINAITGFSGIMLRGIEGPITDLQREDLTSIYQAGEQLLEMINNLYAVKKLDAAGTPVTTQPFPVGELLGNIVQTAQPLCATRDYILTVRSIGNLGTMARDPSRVRWALLTILQYALQWAGGGEIVLEVERDHGEGDQVVFRLTVRPASGCRDRLQVVRPAGDGRDANGVTNEEDPALNLYHRACQELHGDLCVETTDDQTCTFTFRLPAENPA